MDAPSLAPKKIHSPQEAKDREVQAWEEKRRKQELAKETKKLEQVSKAADRALQVGLSSRSKVEGNPANLSLPQHLKYNTVKPTSVCAANSRATLCSRPWQFDG